MTLIAPLESTMVILIGQIDRVTLTPPAPIDPASGGWQPRLLITVLLVGLVVSMVARWRADLRRPLEERAFEKLARRLKVSRRRRRLIEQLAQRTSVPAVALLISEHAFDQAASAFEPIVAHAAVPREARIDAKPRARGLSDGALLALRQALFGE